jgi:uncharacterized protein (TIGR03492 family)
LDIPAGTRRLLFISNGYGEDSIAAEIIRRLPDNFIVEAYPTIGSGSAYNSVCPIVGPRATLASEGSRVQRGSLPRDVAAGGLGTVMPGLRFLRKVANHYDRVIVVGDLLGVAGCWLAGIRRIVFLDVYRTGAAKLYSGFERWLIARTCSVVFCRAQNLADQLKAAGVDARAAGNIMMDTIGWGDYDVMARRRSDTAVTLLPGSRRHAIENFAAQVAGLRLLAPERVPDIFLSVARGVEVEDLADAGGFAYYGPMTPEAGDLGTLRDETLTIHLTQNALGNLLEATDVVLSQAGTATIQAMGLGRPVITFNKIADRPKRIRDEQALFGDAWVRVSGTPGPIARAVSHLLRDTDYRTKLGNVGRERIGGPGAIDAVLRVLIA